MPNNPGGAPRRAISETQLQSLLAKLDALRRDGVFTAEQFEDERQRLIREAGDRGRAP